MIDRKLSCFVALLVCAQAFAAGAEDVRSARPLDVAAPGWVHVPLESEVLRKSAAAGGHLRILDPRGLEVPYGRAAAAGEEQRAVTVTAVEETPTGWWLALDLGVGPPRHDGLVVALSQKTLARGCRLESSPDGVTFKALAVGDLFRVGEDATLAVREIRYPATGDRFLRLFWPAAAGYPDVESVAVETVSSRAFQLESGRPECHSPKESRETSCRLALAAGSAGLRRLDLAIEAKGAVGFRLSKPVAGHWRLVAEGLWTETASERSLPVEAVAADTETLLLELYGQTDPATVRRFRAEFDAEELLFEARIAGRYELIYGAGVPETSHARPVAPPAGATSIEVTPGEEITNIVPGLPSDAVLGAPAPPVTFARMWRVAAPDHAAGVLFRLALPEESYGVGRSELGDLRLLAEGRQVPFVRWQPAEPALVTEWAAVTAASGSTSRSRFELPLELPALPLSTLSLEAPPSLRFERRVTVRWERTARPGAPQESGVVGDSTWACQPLPPLPCRLDLDLDRLPADAARLFVDVADGDDSPLPSIKAALWRRLDVLLFFWPQDAERVTLEAGAPELAAPRYEMESRRSELLARHWRPASVIAETSADDPGHRGRWILLGSLGLAALFLLGLLHRILKDRETGSD